VEAINARVTVALPGIIDEGLDPQTAYDEDDADCDNYSMWIQSDVTKQWAKEKHGTGALAFGRALLDGHDLNIAVTTDGIHVWNYGMYVPDFDLSKVKEVEFK